MNRSLIHKKDIPVIETFIQQVGTGEVLWVEEPERRKIVDRLNKKRRKRKQKTQICSFPECGEIAIQKSHTLSDKLMLEPIAENKHIYTVKADTFKGKNVVDKISIHDFSTFPGFCEKHENLFTFEKEGCLTNGKELQMQLFRSVCRHIHFLEYEIDSLTDYIDTIEPFVVEKIRRWYESVILESDFDTILRLVKNHFLGVYRLMIKQRKLDLDFTKNTWYRPNADNFGNVIDYEKFHDELIIVPKLLPLALSGPVLFDDCDRDFEQTPNFEQMYYVNLFPNKNKTLIHLVSLKKEMGKIVFISDRFEDGFEKGSVYLQKWITENLDLWALNPSYWENISPEIRDGIENKISMLQYKSETRFM